MQKDTIIFINDIKDTTTQDGGLKSPSQLKMRKTRVQSMTPMLTTQREVCRIYLIAINSLILFLFILGSNPNMHEPKVPTSTPNY